MEWSVACRAGACGTWALQTAWLKAQAQGSSAESLCQRKDPGVLSHTAEESLSGNDRGGDPPCSDWPWGMLKQSQAHLYGLGSFFEG